MPTNLNKCNPETTICSLGAGAMAATVTANMIVPPGPCSCATCAMVTAGGSAACAVAALLTMFGFFGVQAACRRTQEPKATEMKQEPKVTEMKEDNAPLLAAKKGGDEYTLEDPPESDEDRPSMFYCR